ncbi:fatty acid synthase [Amylocystis lapponica]|nr:fatty acid synthase [Amylocystis lapponica]
MSATPTPSITTRPVLIQSGPIRVSIPVSTERDEWIAAEVLRDEFAHAQIAGSQDASSPSENESQATIELFAHFLGFAAQKIDENAEYTAARTAVLLKSLQHFTTSYLTHNDIHTLAAAFDPDARNAVLTAYFQALAALEAKNVAGIPLPPPRHSSLPHHIATHQSMRFSAVKAQMKSISSRLESFATASRVRLGTRRLNLRVCIASSTSMDSFFDNVRKALKWLFFCGFRGQQAFPVLALEPSIVKDAIDGGEGAPSPMLSVIGLSQPELEVHITKTNQHLPQNSQLQISLYNGTKAFVVTGPARALYGLVTSLRKVRAPSGVDQSKTPFSQRKPVFYVRFLLIGVPYHSHYLEGVTEKMLQEDLGGEEVWKPEELGIPVFNTENGSDLRSLTTSLTASLCEQIYTLPIHWPKATDFPDTATHVIDFGPGGLSGIGTLTARNFDGRGVRSIVAGDKAKGVVEIFSSRGVKREEWWSKKFMPGLVKTSDGTIHIDTPFSRLLGKPPIMVAGMTPTTVKAGFVSAVLSAGYHVELAGGGHYNAAALREKVTEIQRNIPAGVGVTLNALYINPRQFGFQFPLWQEMRREGLPIEGFCVAAGIPSTEKAAEIIDALRTAGIKHVAFKPGSVDGIRQVINIAGANPDFPIIMQWTGGRAGGHHSCEDFHQPILSTYRSIRQHSNISLVGGSGFGGADDVWPYLTGDCRVMVAKEAHTSSSVKDLIVAAKGVDDAQWEGTYTKETGGVLTVRSELGEPIHKIANRAVKLWKHSTTRSSRCQRRSPWFGWKKDGSVVEDIADMTYEEVVTRMVRLMYVAHEERWVDLSLRNLTGDWLRRVEERFAGVNGGGAKASILQSYTRWTSRRRSLGNSSRTAEQKPVPFIPVLDASFEVWLKGAGGSQARTVKDEPIKDMLDNITLLLVKKLVDRLYNGDVSKIPTVDYLGSLPAKVADASKVPGITRAPSGSSIAYSIGQTLPDHSLWLETLAGPRLNWIRAFLTSPTIVQGTSYIDNPIRRLFAPRRGQKIVIESKDASPVSISVFGSARSYGVHKDSFKAVYVKYDEATHVIDVTLFEDRRDISVPLFFKFLYKPSMGFAPIHEVAEGRNHRIKEFYWKLWFGDDEVLPSIDLRETFVGPEVTIEAGHVETFCAVIGNDGEAFKSVRTDKLQAPMDFAIVTGWQAIMKSIFPAVIDGDILKLVHLSNGFRLVGDAKPLQAGDVCKAEARVVSVINSDAGKTVKVKGFVLRGGLPVIEVISSFLYRGRFSDYDKTFELIEEPDYLVELASEADVGVLQSKEWFEWDDESKPLQAGTDLIFRVKSEVTYRNKTCYKSVSVSGDIFVRDQIKRLVKVGSVDFLQDDSRGNPVVTYLERHGQPQGRMTPLPNDGYTLTSADSIYNSPVTNEPYSKISGDFNPIHINPYFSDFAGLPGTITHGMWSSAATRRYIENVVAHGHPDRVVAYDVTFAGMILPQDRLTVTIKHVGMRDGNIVVKVETMNDNGDKVLVGTAEVAQPSTVYVFTGQGSQEPGQPEEKTVHFGGIKGQAIRQRYMDMTYDTMDKDGNVKTLPLFGDIDVRTQRYTFSHPNGLLFATQFAQIALVVTERAAFEDLRSKGLIQKDSAFAGHSLGEYSALASIADVLAISALVDVVFYRGITMQRAVERDAHNRSNYAMCAVNPGRISKTFNDAALREVVDDIAHRTGCLLEIVNFNVEILAEVALGSAICMEKIDIAKVKAMLGDIVDSCFTRAKEQQKAEGYIKLERGFATIPLPGIDVPFHSRYLWAGVMPFRAYLSKKVNVAHLNPDTLIGKYVPNLVAKPFQVTKDYVQLIYDQTLSPRLDKVLRKWDSENWGSAEQRQKLAYVILVELLAYQFASPVRWIETQDILFSHYDFARFIEIGPSPTLTGMATRTLKAKYETQDDSVSHVRAIYCHAKNTKEVYYQFEDEAEAPAEEASQSDATPLSTPPAAAAATLAAPIAAPVAAASIEDAPLKAVDILSVVVAQKLKKKVEEIPLSKSIKDLVGGKSTLQNEILGDLQLEFSSAPEKGEELPLEELGSALGVGFSGSLGKYTSGLVSRLVGSKMPGGFNVSAIKSYLSKTWGLGSSRADGVLLLGTTMEPPKRLGSEAEAKAWFDSVVPIYAQRSGISLAAASAGASGAGGAGGPTINSEEFIQFQAGQEKFAAQQVELYMRYLKRDSRAGETKYDVEKANVTALQTKLDAISKEHGATYIDGIQPVFDVLKARHFDSSWNWVRQDALLMFYDIIFGRLTTVDREITARCIAIMNRADPELVTYMQYYINRCDPTRGETYKLAKQFGQQLIDNCREVVGQPPLYKDVTFPTAPHTEVTAKGDIVYSEVVRENVRKLEAYVEEMASGDTITAPTNIQKIQDDVLKLWNVVKTQPEISEEQKNRIKALYEGVVRSLRKRPESRPRPGAPRTRRSSSQFLRPQISNVASVTADKVPLLHLKRKVGTNWEYSSNLTGVYLDILHEIATSGTTFKDKNALLTGVGKGSIGVEILKGLLSGGAHVVITTSRYSRATVEYYQGIFQQSGSKGSALTVVPFNQGSKQDVEALVDYIYSTLGLDLDYVLPFAAVPENGRQIDGLDDKSELAHRIMLVNLLRLLGAIKIKKASRHILTRPTQVILPLSPNHGLFGNDGLYSESKISLETLFNRWNSESWGEYLCLAGAVIGWTRGTGLMDATNTFAHELESHGVRTFSAKEMSFNILGLMHPLLFSITQVEPIWADLNGGMDRLPDLADITTRIRLSLNRKSELRRAIARDNAADFKAINGVEAERVLQTVDVTPRANFKFQYPALESVESLSDVSNIRGLLDLEQVVVVTGFAEVGPWGSSRTRWEMEARGQFTIEGSIEMAWMMGYIKHFDGRLKDGSLYVGWVDTKSGEPVDDKDVRARYEKDILAHAGVRLIEPFEAAEVDAEKFKYEHGDNCDIWAGEGGQWYVKFKKGARVFVPKAFKFNRLVAGQIPTGWDAGRYGIPQDIIAQTDRSSLWALVCAAEALNMSGITDPYELYQHMHPSEVGSTIGSGMGGMQSLSKMFKDRRDEKDVQNDILQETFINTTAGWVNLLLLSSSGPIKIPVGACATALQSVEIACDTLLSGKAKVMLAGGFDDLSEEGSYEFGNMKATSNSETEFAMGREPTEMSRPATTTRAGFMEAQGTGVHVLMTAKIALELGCPIRGIVGFTSTSTDKAGRSVPAPGRGALSIAREVPTKHPLPILDVAYRSRQLSFRRNQIAQWLTNERQQLQEELQSRESHGDASDEEYLAGRVADIEQEAARQEKDALATYGMLQGADPRISPLRRALAVWGLTADDVGVLSIHGTGTGANEANETHIWNDVFGMISRTPGNAVPIMAQKSLCGHSKGGSAAWQLAGLLQSVHSGIVPGNRNADNVDADFRQYTYLMFPSKSIYTDGIRAGLMSSFGFGQVGGTCMIVHPRYLFGAIEPSAYEKYKIKNVARARQTYKAMTEMMTHNSLVKVKDAPPYTKDLEAPVLMNSLARTTFDPKTGGYVYTAKLPSKAILDTANAKAVSEILSDSSTAGVGVDQELISSVPSWNPTFLERNFTDAEIAYCQSQPSPPSSFAARWVGKEAVFKSLGVSSKGAAAPMKDIEILPDESGVPTVSLHGDAQAAAKSKGVTRVHLSLSHSETTAIAFAQATSS